ncbi:MAG: hypothetical protein WBP61_17465 [Nocardioides sp.]
MSEPTITDVTGGAAGLAAAYDAVRRLADLFDLAGSELRDWAGLGVRTLTEPGLTLSAPLSPASFAAAEVAVLAATTGSGGVLAESLRWEADAVLVRVAITGLEVTDRMVEARLKLVVDPVRRASVLSLLYGGDGRPAVSRRGRRSSTPPDDLTDLVRHLAEVARLSDTPDSPDNGTIEIQTVGRADRARHIVYLPGTDDMTTLPWTQDDDVRDLAANLLLYAGHPNSHQQGILAAMHDAGIAADDPVLLVGHSQGGMAAAAILSQGSDFNVTHVVTAGSPTAQVPAFPDGTHVLSLEHEGDVVPAVDLAPNPDSVEQVTVTFAGSDGPRGIEGMHAYAHYEAGAAVTAASPDPSIQEQLTSLQTSGFLGTTGPATSEVFQITRQP